jgi:hypothetical protein
MTETMIEERPWKEFQNAGLLWWINRILHTFGWAVVFEQDEHDSTVQRVYPARVKFRGFDDETETTGFVKVTEHLKANVDKWINEVYE